MGLFRNVRATVPRKWSVPKGRISKTHTWLYEIKEDLYNMTEASQSYAISPVKIMMLT